MDVSSFFTDHWKDIEEERIARYEQMFVWREGQRALLAPAQIAAGHRVLDLGAGPGFFALALADMVGSEGRVAGVDINARFVSELGDYATSWLYDPRFIAGVLVFFAGRQLNMKNPSNRTL